MDAKRSFDQVSGCLTGGAIGDALGAPIEFMPWDRIRSAFGPQGLTDYAEAYGRKGAFSDDTQMLLFTAEGLILSRIRPEYREPGQVSVALYHAYLRWLYTQDAHVQGQLLKTWGTCALVDGTLTARRELYARRAPGNTCLSALRSGRMGTMGNPVNDSKGCGGVMRVAPVGLVFQDADLAFRSGCDCAAITHGHPTGFLASGFLAAVIAQVFSGDALGPAICEATRILRTYVKHEECLRAVECAVEAGGKAAPSPAAVESLGAGWVAEEALAIGLYCALVAEDDFKKGVLLAVNHSGDSDSTGSITGNIIGAIYGMGAIPEKWTAELELKDVIDELAGDLFDQAIKH